MRDKLRKRVMDALRDKATADGKTLYLWDSDLTGFGAVCTKTGSCSYFIEYRLGGRGTQSKRVTIGKHGVLTPDEARKVAKAELGKVARGTDVAQAKKEQRDKLTSLSRTRLSATSRCTKKIPAIGAWRVRGSNQLT